MPVAVRQISPLKNNLSLQDYGIVVGTGRERKEKKESRRQREEGMCGAWLPTEGNTSTHSKEGKQPGLEKEELPTVRWGVNRSD